LNASLCADVILYRLSRTEGAAPAEKQSRFRQNAGDAGSSPGNQMQTMRWKRGVLSAMHGATSGVAEVGKERIDFRVKQKGRLEAGLSENLRSDADQYRATTGPPQLKR
jgi:hypothetical protein